MPTPEKHALLSASSSERWLHCPASVQLTKDMPDTTSEYAEEGRLAHAIAELKVRKKFIEPMGSRTFNTRMNKLKRAERYQEEMQSYTDSYLDYISEIVMSFPSTPYITVEKQVDYSNYAPEGFGTCDCIILGGDILHIIDFKYGKGVPVSAEGNAQMRLYALGTLNVYSALYGINTIKMTIVQPRLDRISTDEVPMHELLDWGINVVKPKAVEAYEGTGGYFAGDWCRWCKAKAICQTRAGDCLSTVEEHGYTPINLLCPEDMADILSRAGRIKKWLTDVQDYALKETLAGRTIPGWKVTEGRSVRAFADSDAAFDLLKQNGYSPDLLYERKPLPLTGVESLLGKKQFQDLLGPFVVKAPGKPTLVPETDQRPPYQKSTAKGDFAELIQTEKE